MRLDVVVVGLGAMGCAVFEVITLGTRALTSAAGGWWPTALWGRW